MLWKFCYQPPAQLAEHRDGGEGGGVEAIIFKINIIVVRSSSSFVPPFDLSLSLFPTPNVNVSLSKYSQSLFSQSSKCSIHLIP